MPNWCNHGSDKLPAAKTEIMHEFIVFSNGWTRASIRSCKFLTMIGHKDPSTAKTKIATLSVLTGESHFHSRPYSTHRCCCCIFGVCLLAVWKRVRQFRFRRHAELWKIIYGGLSLSAIVANSTYMLQSKRDGQFASNGNFVIISLILIDCQSFIVDFDCDILDIQGMPRELSLDTLTLDQVPIVDHSCNVYYMTSRRFINVIAGGWPHNSILPWRSEPIEILNLVVEISV
jgi:hypothetical protein